MYIYGDGKGHIQKRTSTFKLEIAVTSDKPFPREFLMSAADRCTIFLPPDTNGPSSPQYDTFLEKKKIISPHAHSSYRHSGSRRRDLKVSGKKKVYHSADCTGDARCPCNACEIARISCNPTTSTLLSCGRFAV